MSILIKGMEMPKNCFECPWRCKVDPENLLCRISGEYFEETFSGTIQNRHKSCPLIHVPLHGRLIDADALKAEFPEPNEANGGWRNPDEAIVHKTDVWACIDCAPTIIQAEEGE